MVRTLHVFIHLILVKSCEVDTISLILRARKRRFRLSDLAQGPTASKPWSWALIAGNPYLSPAWRLPLQRKSVIRGSNGMT